ncbi:MAG: preprotein translocase subunit SecG [bacterium]|nr:preprotein translocase subunit SecG [bacterium]
MLHTILIVIHVLVCIMLAVVVLLQSSKGGGLAGAFGGAGGAPQQILGSRGITSLLHKLTIYLAVGFFLTSFMLFITDSSGGRPGSVVGDAAREGDLAVPTEDAPPPTGMPLETPAEAPAETPAASPAETPTGGDTSDEESGGGE